jgi:hypothetical protein
VPSVSPLGYCHIFAWSWYGHIDGVGQFLPLDGLDEYIYVQAFFHFYDEQVAFANGRNVAMVHFTSDGIPLFL